VERRPVPIVQEDGWALGPENLASFHARTPDRPSRSEASIILPAKIEDEMGGTYNTHEAHENI